MLAIDVRDCDIMVSVPDSHGGVAPMLVALEEAGLGVTHIEPWAGEPGIYRLTFTDSPEHALRILESIGCRGAATSPLLRSGSTMVA